MKDEWIVVPNWEKFQKRFDRSMPWFMVYYELSRRDDWRSLSLSGRGLLVSIWLEYGPSKARIRSADLTHRAGQRVRRETLDSLVAAGFVQLSATPPPELHARAHARVREEVEKNPPTPRKRGASSNARKSKTTGWRTVRGTHGQTTIPDPDGTDKPPEIGRPL